MQGEIREVLKRADVVSRDENVAETVSTAGSPERTNPPSSPALSECTEESIPSPLPPPEHFSDTNTESRSGKVATTQVFRRHNQIQNFLG